MSSRPLTLAASAAAAFLLFGCAHSTIRVSPSMETSPPRTVVVMPTDPGPAPPQAAALVTQVTLFELARRGYEVRPAASATTDPGAAPRPRDEAAAANADAVLYPHITGFATQGSTFNTSTTVGVGFHLFSAAGDELWVAQWSETASSAGQFGVSGLGLAGAVGTLAVDAANAENQADHPPYDAVLERATRVAIDDIPDGALLPK